MDDAAKLLAWLADQGIAVSRNAGPPERLTIQAAKSLLTPSVLEALQTHKDTLLALLRARDTTPVQAPIVPPAIAPCYCCGSMRFWSAGHDHWICSTCHPPAPGVLRDGVQWRDGRPADTTR